MSNDLGPDLQVPVQLSTPLLLVRRARGVVSWIARLSIRLCVDGTRMWGNTNFVCSISTQSYLTYLIQEPCLSLTKHRVERASSIMMIIIPQARGAQTGGASGQMW